MYVHRRWKEAAFLLPFEEGGHKQLLKGMRAIRVFLEETEPGGGIFAERLLSVQREISLSSQQQQPQPQHHHHHHSQQQQHELQQQQQQHKQ